MRRESWKALLVATSWLLGYVALSRYLVIVLPDALRARLTMSAYLWLVQVLTACIGVGLVVWVTRKNASLRDALLPLQGLAPNSVLAAALAPSVYVLAHGLGMALAYRTLLLELAAHGAKAVQRQSGELGRSVLADSLLVVFPFTVLVAPLAEELLFRGAWFGALRTALSPRTLAVSESRQDEAEPDAPLSVPGLRKGRTGGAAWLPSALAWLGSSLLFGWMHADLSGGMGILRTVSASVLGLACGAARWKTGSVVPAILLHAGFNLASLATLRGWLVFAHFPTKYALPTSLFVVAPLCALLGWAFTRWAR